MASIIVSTSAHLQPHGLVGQAGLVDEHDVVAVPHDRAHGSQATEVLMRIRCHERG